MKTIKIQIKFFYVIARYIYKKYKTLLATFIKQTNDFIKQLNNLNAVISEYKTQVKKLTEKLEIEKEYNLNIRMRRRNKYWRKNRKY